MSEEKSKELKTALENVWNGLAPIHASVYTLSELINGHDEGIDGGAVPGLSNILEMIGKNISQSMEEVEGLKTNLIYQDTDQKANIILCCR